MILQDSVKSIMNPRVISVLTNTPVLIAVDILLTSNFNGIPVTDKEGVLKGILTKYDLIIKRDSIKDDTTAGDIMNKEPLVLEDNRVIDEAIKAFSEHHRVDPIPVVNSDSKVIGIISRYDMVRLFKEYGISSGEVGQIKAENSIQKKGVSGWLLFILFIILASLSAYYFGYHGFLTDYINSISE